MTKILETPAEERIDNDRPIHWCCIRQTDIPFFGLCGELPPAQKRRSGARVNCPRCLELAPDHVVECAACRPFAGKYL